MCSRSIDSLLLFTDTNEESKCSLGRRLDGDSVGPQGEGDGGAENRRSKQGMFFDALGDPCIALNGPPGLFPSGITNEFLIGLLVYVSMLAAFDRLETLAISGEVTKILLLSVLIMAGEEGHVGADGGAFSPLVFLKEGEGEGATMSSPAIDDLRDISKLSLSLSFKSIGACVRVLLDLHRPNGTGSEYELVNPKDGLICIDG